MRKHAKPRGWGKDSTSNQVGAAQDIARPERAENFDKTCGGHGRRANRASRNRAAGTCLALRMPALITGAVRLI